MSRAFRFCLKTLGLILLMAGYVFVGIHVERSRQRRVDSELTALQAAELDAKAREALSECDKTLAAARAGATRAALGESGDPSPVADLSPSPGAFLEAGARAASRSLRMPAFDRIEDRVSGLTYAAEPAPQPMPPEDDSTEAGVYSSGFKRHSGFRR